jgi:ferritin-like metal-binding protein YciE
MRIETMGLFTKDIKTMDDLFVHQLQDIYYAEKQLVILRRETTREGAAEDGRQGKMTDKASDPMLRQGFLTPIEETKGHVKRPKKAPRKLRGAFCDGC